MRFLALAIANSETMEFLPMSLKYLSMLMSPMDTSKSLKRSCVIQGGELIGRDQFQFREVPLVRCN